MKKYQFICAAFFWASMVFAQPRPNVIMISIDDLNDWTTYLKGHEQTRTPNIDRLAGQGVAFTNAFCNAPSCNPSRSSILLGKHPNSTGMYSNPPPPHLKPATGKNAVDMRKYYPTKKTLPQYFRDNGYYTKRVGKVFHFWGDWKDMNVERDDLSFDSATYGGVKNEFKPTTAYVCGIDFGWSFTPKGEYSFMDWGGVDRKDTEIGEYGRAEAAIAELRKNHTKPFFMALGFYLPHLPWYYPKSLLNLPDLAPIRNVNDVKVPAVMADDFSDMSSLAVQIAVGSGADAPPRSPDGKINYANWHDAIDKTGKWKEAVQSYLACTYFVDMQVGRVLNALEASRYKDNTIVVLWSDHGFMLGQKQAWNKYRPWEPSLKVNYIIKAPGIAPAVVDKTVELLSVYNTITDLAGLARKDGVEGLSLVPLLKNPSMEWDHPVVSAHWDENYPLGGWQSVRNNQYRFIRYVKTGDEELYDLKNDPNEWTNLAKNPTYAAVKAEMAKHAPLEMTPLGSWLTPTGNLANRNKPAAANLFSISAGLLTYRCSNLHGTTLRVFTIDGRLVGDYSKLIRERGAKTGTINIAASMSLPGIYFVKMADGQNVETVKFIRTHS